MPSNKEVCRSRSRSVCPQVSTARNSSSTWVWQLLLLLLEWEGLQHDVGLHLSTAGPPYWDHYAFTPTHIICSTSHLGPAESQCLPPKRKLATCLVDQARGKPWNRVPETLSRAQARAWQLLTGVSEGASGNFGGTEVILFPYFFCCQVEIAIVCVLQSVSKNVGLTFALSSL